MNWFDLLAVQGTVKSLQHHSSKASLLWHLAFFIVQLSHPYVTTGKIVMSLLFNVLSKLAIAFLPGMLAPWLQSPSAVILKPRRIRSVTVSTVSPNTCVT